MSDVEKDVEKIMRELEGFDEKERRQVVWKILVYLAALKEDRK